jgi:hypothetical protein
MVKSGDDFSEYSIWLLGKEAAIKEDGQRCWLQFFKKQGESLNDEQTRRSRRRCPMTAHELKQDVTIYPPIGMNLLYIALESLIFFKSP